MVHSATESIWDDSRRSVGARRIRRQGGGPPKKIVRHSQRVTTAATTTFLPAQPPPRRARGRSELEQSKRLRAGPAPDVVAGVRPRSFPSPEERLLSG